MNQFIKVKMKSSLMEAGDDELKETAVKEGAVWVDRAVDVWEPWAKTRHPRRLTGSTDSRMPQEKRKEEYLYSKKSPTGATVKELNPPIAEIDGLNLLLWICFHRVRKTRCGLPPCRSGP